MGCRTYGAHGWINLSMSSPCHLEMIDPIAKEQIVPKLKKEVARKKNMSQEKVKKQKTMAQE